MEADSSQELKLKLAQEIRSDSRKLTEIREISNPNSFRFGNIVQKLLQSRSSIRQEVFFSKLEGQKSYVLCNSIN